MVFWSRVDIYKRLEANVHKKFLTMKKVIFVVMTLLLSSIGVMLVQASDSTESGYRSILRRILPDSIYSSIEGRRILFYTIGHYGYSWSLITMKDSAFVGYLFFG